ncbi:MAG: zinc-ribbon domain-containing protein [Oscillospiraceae bacterium]|jgi:uncharacterized OB-fold protein|nr:zinc-ribbon domain-containing protein [Oscillospiraceae bacterium]
MYCQHCGKQNAEDAMFCQACGKGLGQVAAAPPKPAQPATSYVTTVQTVDAPGKNFLKITGILYIVFAAIKIISAFFLLDTADRILGIESFFGAPATLSGSIAGISIISILIGVFGLIIGILGVKNCDSPGEARTLKILAVIDFIVTVIFLFFNFSWISLLSLAIPILYFIGAEKNREAFDNYGYSGAPIIRTTQVFNGACPSCGNSFIGNRSSCPHCGYRTQTSAAAQTGTASWTCKKCGTRNTGTIFCKDCGTIK